MRIYFFLLLAVPLLSCGNRTHSGPELLPDICLQPRYARGFEVRTDGSQYQLVTFVPGQDHQIGRIIPLRFPFDFFACASTTHLAFFECLGEISRVRASSYAHLVRDNAIASRVKDGQIRNLTTSEDLDREVLLSVNPGALLTVPFVPVDEHALSKTGMQCIPIAEYLEDHPLGRAEWIRLIGFLCGKKENADSVFQAIETRYLAIADSVSDLASARPRVLFSSNESGEWFAPPGNSPVARLIEDAGADYVFADSISSRGNIVLSREDLITMADRIDWWGDLIHFGGLYTRNLAEQSTPGAIRIAAFQNGRLFHCNTAACDYFGKALVEPDKLLADLAAIFHPEQAEDHQAVYFFPTR